MKKHIALLGILAVFASCEERTETPENSRGIPGPEKVEAYAPTIDEQEADLNQRGYQTFRSEEGDSTYLMQQYYVVLLRKGDNREQDSTEAAELQRQHLAHLNRMAEEGYLSMAGPFADDSEISGIAVYKTPSEQEADSLARLDPSVQAGRLEVEVHPWWVARGSRLD